MTIEKTPPRIPEEKTGPNLPTNKMKPAIQTLFSKSRSIKPKSPQNGTTLDRPQYNPMDETQDWIIEDNRLIKPSEDTK